MKNVWKTFNIALSIVAAVVTVTIGHAQSCTVDGNDVHQRIDGFGASSAFSGNVWNAQLANMFFSTNIFFSSPGIGLSLLRTQIQPGGYANGNEIALMQLAQARGARVWSTPWTPQASFKDNNNIVGGNFNPKYNQAYAIQLAGYVANIQRVNGVYVFALSIQNEPDANVTYVSCHWSAQQFHDFIPFLYNALASANVSSTKIILPESQNWNDPQHLAATAMNDPNVAADVGIIADHDYGGGSGPQPNYGKKHWETEVSTFDPYNGSIANGMTWAVAFHAFLTSAQVNAYHYWWLMSENTDNEGLTDNKGNPAKRMFVLGQFSRFVRPGYFRIGVTNNTGNIMISAYQYPNAGNLVIVAINTNRFTSINQTFNLTNLPVPASVVPWITSSTLSLSNQTDVTVIASSFNYTLPAQSVVTFVAGTNLAPTDIMLLNSSVPGGRPAGTTVGNLVTLDPDCANMFTNNLVSGTGGDDNASFSISGSTLKTAVSFNYQTKNSYSVRIRSTDQDGLFVEKAFAININDAPVFSPIANQTINAGMTLTLTNTVTDSDTPTQILTFNLLNGPTNATLTTVNGTNGIFTWRPLVSQADTVNPVSVQVTDNGTPNLSATNNLTITVNPLLGPVLGSIAVSGGQISLVVNGIQGPDYTLLTSTDLINWQALLTMNSPPTPLMMTDTNATSAIRFYRIQLGP